MKNTTKKLILLTSWKIGCAAIAVVLLQTTFSFAQLSVSCTSTNVLCNGTCTGTATANPSGGLPPYTYLWTPLAQTTQTATGLCAGTYTMTVTDAIGATAICTNTITQPTMVIVAGSSTPTTCGLCNGTASVFVAGGTPPYAYLWIPGAQTTQTVTGLCDGGYLAYVTDVNGCTDQDTIAVGQSAGLTIAVQTNSSAGTATANVSGGTAPYNYVWYTNPTQNTQTATGLVPGGYNVCVTDANGCTGCQTFSIGQSACGNRDFEIGDFSFWTAQSGSNGGSSNLAWSGGLNFMGNDVSSSSSAQHTILTINTLDSLAIDPGTGQPDVFMTTLAPNGGLFSVRLGNSVSGFGAEALKTQFSVTAGDTVFTFQFASVFQNAGHATINEPGFMVNVYDASNTLISSLSDTIHAPDPNYPFIQVPPSAPDPTVLYKRWSGVSINLSAYIGQAVTIEFANFDCGFGGHYGYTYIDGSCFGSLIANVWPGDCDYDLSANNVDLLSLGMAYGATGTVRSGASNNWIAQPAADWAQGFPLGANYKHSDCNGDGVVDVNDTLAISLNYGSTHPFKMQPPVYSNVLQDMYLVATADTVGPNTLVNVDIMLGTNVMPVDSIYAIAFSITYDPVYLNAFNIGASFTTSWLGTIGSDMISLQKNLFASARIDLALTRTNHINLFGGNGKIATFTFLTTPVTSVNPGNIPLMITGVKAVTATGQIVSLNTIGDNVYFDPTLLGIPSYLNADLISVFPNPASDDFSVTLPSGIERASVELFNTIGQSVMTVTTVKQTAKMNVSSLPAGMYQMKISCDEGVAMKKIQVVKVK